MSTAVRSFTLPPDAAWRPNGQLPVRTSMGLLSRCLGALSAVYLLAGRWSLSRLDGEPNLIGAWGEPRVWVVALLTLIAVAVSLRSASALRQVGPRAIGLNETILIFLGYFALSAIWAPQEAEAGKKAIELILMFSVALSLTLVHKIINPDLLLRSFWFTVFCICGLLMAIALPSMGSARLEMEGGGANTLGRNMSFLIAAALFMWPRASWLRRLVFLGVAALATLTIVLTGSRGALASLTIGGVAFFLHKRGGKIGVVMTILVAACVAWMIAMATGIADPLWEMFEKRILKQTFEERHLSGRDNLWTAAWETGKDHVVFGIGLNGFRTIRHIYPHNLFLEAFAEGGSMGLVMVVLPFLALIRYHLLYRRFASPPIVLAFAAQFVFSQFSGDMYDSRGIFLLATLSAMVPPAPAAATSAKRVIRVSRVQAPARRPLRAA